ncbi:hypothetical protein E4U21_002183 [Claviceps maximensis]|nr:hypothetical protein E4U21_002183 [Claviceps maximensis]
MHPSHILVGIAALAGATHALAIRNKHVADFRLFGEQGCSRQNQGIWTVIDEDFRPNECKSLGGSLPRSIRNVDVNRGCTLSFYSDDACSATSKRECAPGQCCDSAQGWRSWSMVC